MFKSYYFDNSATTKTRKEVRRVMKKYFSSRYGNPSSMHKSGIIAKGSIEMAREQIGVVLNADSHNLIFTGSGSEGNNTAIQSALNYCPNRTHIISSRIEHSSVFNTLENLKSHGYTVTYIPVDHYGRYDLEALEESITSSTALITLGYANNEVGTIQDVHSLTRISKRHSIPLHLDAVQALPYEVINLRELGADYVTFSGHKVYAPKGIGLMYIKDLKHVTPLIQGGGQEFNLRSGTENVPYIIGLAKAITLNHQEKSKYNKRLSLMSNKIMELVMSDISDVKLTGHPKYRVPNMASFAVKGIDGKILAKKLSTYNISISSGSACSSAKTIPSRVLNALHYDDNYINGSIRISLGKYNTMRQLKHLMKSLKKSIKELRSTDFVEELVTDYISQPEFSSLQNNESLQIIDVRMVTVPRLPINNIIELPLWKLKKGLSRLSPSLQTVIICNDGDLIGPQAQSILIQNGFVNVRLLSGGSKGYALYKKTSVASII